MTKNKADSAFGPFAIWTDASQYPDPDSTPIEQWVWEFVRRNHQYQADWKSESEAYPRYEVDDEFIPRMFQFQVDPDVAIYTRHTRRGRKHYLDEYGLQYLINPTVANPEPFYLHFAFKPGRVVSPRPYGDLERHQPDNYVYVTIDLDYPLERQFLIARTELQQRLLAEELVFNRKPRGRQKRSSEWPGYLRVLDADEAGVGIRQIAEVLYPTLANVKPDYNADRTVRDDLVAANKLRDEDFRYIVLQQSQTTLKERLRELLKNRRDRYVQGMKRLRAKS